MGARLAAKFLPTHQHTEVSRVGTDVHSAFRHSEGIVAHLGSRSPKVPSGSTYPALRFVFQASTFSNPAVVRVEVHQSGEKGATHIVIARAKEGLFRQHAARKSAQYVSRALPGELRDT